MQMADPRAMEAIPAFLRYIVCYLLSVEFYIVLPCRLCSTMCETSQNGEWGSTPTVGTTKQLLHKITFMSIQPTNPNAAVSTYKTLLLESA